MLSKLNIEKLSDEGRGLSHTDRPWFVLGALPGETIEARVLKKYKGIYEAVATSVPEQAAPTRTKPACQHFLSCGGCSLQHMAYEAQVAFKYAKLKELWQRHDLPEPEWLPPAVSASTGYRRKARVSLRYVEKKQKLLLGFKELDARKILDMQSCSVLTPAITQHLFALQAVLSEIPERLTIPQLELVEGNEGVAVVIRHLKPLAATTINALQAFAATSSWQVWLQSAGPDSLLALDPASGFLHYDLPDYNLRLAFAPLDFVQVNAAVNQKMIAIVAQWLELKPTETLLDLFCGLGNFSLPLAQSCRMVLGVEGSEEMVTRASANASLAKLSSQTKFFAHDLRQNPEHTPWFNLQFDKVLLDPPRSGAQHCLPWLLRKKPKRIVYVSCNPKTMMNDLLVLVNNYRISAACMADMFPHTAHTEALVCLDLME